MGTFFENAPFGLALVGVDRKLVHVNPAMTRLLGYSEDELRERTWDSLTHPDDAPENLELFEELRQGKRQGFQFEKRYLRRDGSAVWVKVTASAAHDPSGLWLMGVIEDITELVAARQKREQAVLELGRQVRALRVLHATVVASRAGACEQLLRTVAQRLPEAFESPVGITVRLGASSATGGVEGGRSVLLTSFSTAAGESGAIELRMPEGGPQVGDAERALLESVAETVRAEFDRSHAAARAQTQHERLELALARAEMGVWEFDVASGLVTFSEHLGRMLGIAGQHQQPFEETGKRVHPEDAWVLRERVAALLASPAPTSQLRIEFRLMRPDGGWRRVSAVGRLLRDAEGRPTRLLAMLADVSRERALEDDQRQKQKLAVLAQMSPHVVRELDEVVSAMQSGARQARSLLPPGDPSLELLDDIDTAIGRGASLADRLRSFGGGGTGQKTRFELAEMVRASIPILARVAGERIKLEPRLSDGAVVFAERDALERALLNLVVNARDATTGTGRIIIDVSLFGENAVLAVQDEGVGMPPEIVARLAEPFFSTKREGQGTGLGVPVVFDAAARAAGRVEVTSQPGQGTRIQLVIPRAR